MNIIVTTVFVDDQEAALKFYTETLGFQKKTDIPMGQYRWLTVTDDNDGVELLLEPSAHPAVPPFKKALVKDGIPFAAFGVADIDSEFERLTKMGVEFTQPPTKMGTAITAVLNDTCGNLIQLVQNTA